MTTRDETPHEEVASAPAGPETGDGSAPPTPDQIRADIERTREELGQTVEALSAKLDVKTRTKERIVSLRENAQQRVDQGRLKATELTANAKETAARNQEQLRIAVPVVVAVGAGTTVAVLLWRRHRRRSHVLTWFGGSSSRRTLSRPKQHRR